jgi:hypothetical protein
MSVTHSETNKLDENVFFFVPFLYNLYKKKKKKKKKKGSG